MSFFRTVYYFFSRYTDPAERRVGRFFSGVRERDSPHKLEKTLLRLLQQDIAVVNLWTEHRYKGYDYLSKRERTKLYGNLQAIKQDFATFAAEQTVDAKQIFAHLSDKGIDTAMLRTCQEQLVYLAIIMRYLSPKHGRYIYRESSSFGRLLRDPTKETLEGDCNQIVTLYIALYATKYDISDLKLTLYPGHVALHFHGVDIETTNGTFAKYNKDGQVTAPIHEIVSVNLLDTTDVNFAKTAINPEVFLQAARLAYVVSSHRQLVKRNLEAAYHNTVRYMLGRQQFQQALVYAKQSKDHELIEISARNGAVHAMKQHDFSGARQFAQVSQKKADLMRTIDQHEAAYFYNLKQYQQAIKYYERLGDRKMIGQCYRGLYVQEQSRLGSIKTTADIRANAGIIRSMERYAKLSGDSQLTRHVQSLTKHL
jgi:hypothetical protein